ncbi:MAG: DUF6868 family protein [Victivallaceae bacterium]
MKRSKQAVEFFEILAQVLLKCFLWTVIVMLLWLMLFLRLGDWLLEVNSCWLVVSISEFDSLNYWGIATLKLIAIVFFLIPYISIRMTIKKKKKK